MEFLGNIGIEPKLVLAQVINFLALVFILRLLAYKPLVAIFKKRGELTKKLESDLAEVEKKKKEAEAAYQAKILDGQSRANEIIRQARRAAETLGEGMMGKNREYLDQLLRETKARIEGAKSELAKLNREAIAAEASRTVAQFLTQTLQRELHERLVAEALDDFEELQSREEDIAFKESVQVLAAYTPSRQAHSRLQRLLQQKFGKSITCSIEVEPGLKAGIIIRWGGYELDGSLRGRLARLHPTQPPLVRGGTEG